LVSVLGQCPKPFSGKLGCFSGTTVHLELVPNAVPFTCRPYKVPRHHEAVFQAELKRLCEINALEPCGPSEWLSPTFIIPKTDGRVRWITDFRALHKSIKRKAYNLPTIQDILLRRPGYAFFSKLDTLLQYYLQTGRSQQGFLLNL
jgi:hypothetical protein